MTTADESDGGAEATADDGKANNSSESSERHSIQSGGTRAMRAATTADESNGKLRLTRQPVTA